MKPILNKWQYGFYLGRDWASLRYILKIWCAKIKEMPDEGAMLSIDNYNGFVYHIYAPRITKFRTFILPIRLRIVLLSMFKIRTHDVYVIPTAFSFN